MSKAMIFGQFVIVSMLPAQSIVAQEGSERKAEQRTIPLSQIVSTSSQTGLESVDAILRKKKTAPVAGDSLRQVLDSRNGSSNVFLVDATTLDDALDASSVILVGSRAADAPVPVNTAKPKRGSHWLVVYLGVGPSEPVWWSIEAVSFESDKVLVSYRKAKPGAASRDLHYYYYWVPLGKLPAGTYQLQLFDVEKKATTLMRRVEVVSN